MIKVITGRYDNLEYDVRGIAMSFYPGEDIAFVRENEPQGNAVIDKVAMNSRELADHILDLEKIFDKTRDGQSKCERGEKAVTKNDLRKKLYHHLEKETGRSLPWGILIGIRPTKLTRQFIEREVALLKIINVENRNAQSKSNKITPSKTRGSSSESNKITPSKTWGSSEETIPSDLIVKAAKWMQDEYLVSPEKSVLASVIAARELQVLGRKKVAARELQVLGERKETLRAKALQKSIFTEAEQKTLRTKASQKTIFMEAEQTCAGFSLYIGIPFCPSRCSYCSFASQPASLWEGRMGEYVDALIKELEEVSKMMARNVETAIQSSPATAACNSKAATQTSPAAAACNSKAATQSSPATAACNSKTPAACNSNVAIQQGIVVQPAATVCNSIYIGGGTPTTLPNEDLERLLKKVRELFAPAAQPGAATENGATIAPTAQPGAATTPAAIEFTVEAGRPDTITKEKLAIMKRQGVNRISINPQSMNEKTLAAIGRNHKVEDIIRAFNMARKAGFDNINMDIILGLPGENPEDVKKTLSEIKKLHPDSLTVHALAVKRAARLNLESDHAVMPGCSEEDSKQMMTASSAAASDLGLTPYYMYRQKNMAGNLENVGYARPGKECYYNIAMMEETESIVACGAGTVSKCVRPPHFAAAPLKHATSVATAAKQVQAITRCDTHKDPKLYIEQIDEMIARKRRLFG